MLCDKLGKFLFQARPDLFPDGYLTDAERQLWSWHFEEIQKTAKRQ